MVPYMVTPMRRSPFESSRRHTSVLYRAPKRKRTPFPILIFLGYIGLFGGIVLWWWATSPDTTDSLTPISQKGSVLVSVPTSPLGDHVQKEQRIMNNIGIQAKTGVRYSSKYYKISYPGGDVPSNVGVSTDVVIRALRAIDIDLQELIFQDRVKNPDQYPLERWSNTEPDKSVDHRRVINLSVFMKQFSRPLPLTKWSSYRPGDVIFWRIGNGEFPDHVGVVLDATNSDDIPLVAELNSQSGKLSVRTPANLWPVRGHYRLLNTPEASD